MDKFTRQIWINVKLPFPAPNKVLQMYSPDQGHKTETSRPINLMSNHRDKCLFVLSSIINFRMITIILIFSVLQYPAEWRDSSPIRFANLLSLYDVRRDLRPSVLFWGFPGQMTRVLGDVRDVERSNWGAGRTWREIESYKIKSCFFVALKGINNVSFFLFKVFIKLVEINQTFILSTVNLLIFLRILFCKPAMYLTHNILLMQIYLPLAQCKN